MPRDVTSHLLRPVVPKGTTRHGLVIGIDKYADKRLNLRYAAADARVLRELMIDAECGCFPHENVQLLLDDDATTERIFRALARLRRQVAEDDVVWIYFAGHAAMENHAYWVTHDTDVDDLFATALDSDRINSVLSQFRTPNLLLILDCCHAAATALVKNQTRAVVAGKDLFGRFQGHGRITLAASDGEQNSVELSEFGHGAFTYFLVKGLRGEADADNDGVVTADELWSYLRRKVSEASGHAGNPQTPMLSGAMTHDVALTINVAVAAHKQRLMSEIERLVGLRADQLTTDEGRYCEEILLHGARTERERSLLESLDELAAGQLTQSQFRRFVQASRKQIASKQAALSADQADAPHGALQISAGSGGIPAASSSTSIASAKWSSLMADNAVTSVARLGAGAGDANNAIGTESDAGPANRKSRWLLAIGGIATLGVAGFLVVRSMANQPAEPRREPVTAAAAPLVVPGTTSVPDTTPIVDAAPDAPTNPHPEMVWIEGGSGLEIGETKPTDGALPRQRVTVESFWIDRNEMTRGGLEAALSDKLPAATRQKIAGDAASTPARFVDWDTARAACAAVGKRLSTEPEWEVAALTTPQVASRAKLQRKGTEEDLTTQSTTDCSEAGLCDMLGGLHEWTATAAKSSTRKESMMVVRGASYRWGEVNRFASIHARALVPATTRDNTLGFRCVVSAPGEDRP